MIKFHFGDVAHRFIARSFAKSSALALLGCVRKTLSLPLAPSVVAANSSLSDVPVASGNGQHAAAASANPVMSCAIVSAPSTNSITISIENDGMDLCGSSCVLVDCSVPGVVDDDVLCHWCPTFPRVAVNYLTVMMMW
jgi:hypothetical protein